MSLRERRSPTNPWQGHARRAASGWRPLGQGIRPSVALRPWLMVKTSLTRKLEEAHGCIRVEVLQQRFGQPFSDEAHPSGPPCVIRDVLLKNTAGQILVLAHSILPVARRGALHPMLKRLGRQALGSLLFTRPGFERCQREWAQIDVRHPLYRAAQAQIDQPLPKKLWARRACFSPLRSSGSREGSAQTVQVTEVFLPLP